MKKLLKRIKDSKYILLVIFIVMIRFLFTIKIPNFYIKNMTIDDSLMINQMMLLSQRTFFRHILSKNTY